MPLEYIEFNGEKYAIRFLILQNGERVLVSTEELNNALFDKNGQYISIHAQNIDEQIFFFVNASDINMPQKKLSKLVYREALA